MITNFEIGGKLIFYDVTNACFNIRPITCSFRRYLCNQLRISTALKAVALWKVSNFFFFASVYQQSTQSTEFKHKSRLSNRLALKLGPFDKKLHFSPKRPNLQLNDDFGFR